MVDGITLGAPLVVEEAPAIAVLTGAPPATTVITTALSLNHFRPPTLDSSSLIARARVVYTGSTFTVAEGPRLAGPGEILVSGTVRDLVTGSGLRFTDRGRYPLKGIEGDWPALRWRPSPPADPG